MTMQNGLAHRLPKDPLAYDATALRDSLVRKHGADLGVIVYDVEVERRRLQAAKCEALTTEVVELQRRVTALCVSATAQRDRLQREADATYATYVEQLAAIAVADTPLQAEIASLQAESVARQREITTVVDQREAERSLRTIANQNSTNAAMLARHDNAPPRPPAPPLSPLARVNLMVPGAR